uniref:SH3 domain-containing protein n=1 Tax=Romanomermis culicivorax TaxID=13658 RepID=A0A915K2F7_ROMCU
ATDIRTLPVYIAIREYKPDPKDKDALPLEEGQIVEVLDQKNPSSWLVRTKSRPPQTGWVPGSYFETPAEYYRQKRTTREITGGDLHLSSQEESLAKRE